MAKKKVQAPRGIRQAAKTTEELVKQTLRVGKALKKRIAKPATLAPPLPSKKTAGKAKVQKPSGKKVVAQSTKRKIEKPSKQAPRKRVYTLQELPLRKHPDTLAGTLTQIDREAPKLDKLKDQGDMWYATIFGHYTMIPFTSLSLLKSYFYDRYEPLIQYGNQPDKQSEVLDSIGIVSFRGKGKQPEEAQVAAQFHREREKFVEEHKKREESILQAIEKLVTQAKPKVTPKKGAKPMLPPAKPKNKTDKLVSLLEESVNIITDLQKRIAQLEKSAKKASKPKRKAKPAKKAPARSKPAKKAPARSKPAKKAPARSKPVKLSKPAKKFVKKGKGKR